MTERTGVRRGASLLVSLVVAAAVAALVASGVLAAAGDLDPSFSHDGKVRTPVGGGNSGAAAVAIDSQGRIVLAGASQPASASGTSIAVIRYRPNGTLDPTFSGDGKVITSMGPSVNGADMAIDSQGRIVVVGTRIVSGDRDFAVVRYRPNGTLDSTFSHDGKQTTDFGTADDGANAVAIDGQDRVIAGGTAGPIEQGHFTLTRYRTNGTLDPSFSGDGKQKTRIKDASDIRGLAIDSQGRIVAAGGAFDGVQSDFALARYRPNGSLDPAFQGGTVLTQIGASDDIVHDLTIDDQDRPVAVGQAQEGSARINVAAARYRTDGSADPTFSHDGKTITHVGVDDSAAFGVTMDARGRAVVAGFGQGSTFILASEFAVARYRANGSLDPTFSGDGQKLTSFSSFGDSASGIAIDARGRLVLGGGASTSATENDFAAVRYLG